MLWKPQFLLLFTVFVFGFIFSAFVTRPLQNVGDSTPNGAVPENRNGGGITAPSKFNIFAPPRELPEIPRIESLPKFTFPGGVLPTPLPPPESKTIEEINDIVFPTLIPPKPTEMLPLPQVSEAELAIDQSGIKTLAEYITYFNAHAKEVNFDFKKLGEVVSRESGVPMMPAEVIEKMIAESDIAALKNSLLVLHEFVRAKMNYEKSIKVFGTAIETNRRMIGFDMITLQMLEKALDVVNGNLAKAELGDFYKKYQLTRRFYGNEFRKEYGGSSFFDKNEGPLGRLLNIFGLGKIAHALGIPFGGFIGGEYPCTPGCDVVNGYVIYVAGPGIPAVLYVTPLLTTSPFYTAPVHVGSWILGFYEPSSAVCLVGAPPYCIAAPIPIVGVPGIAGTGI